MNEYQRGLNNTTINKFDDEIVAGTHRAWVEQIIENSDGQIEVLPVEGVDENGKTYSILEEFKSHCNNKSYLQAKELLVPIRIGQWWKLRNENTISYDVALREWRTTLSYSSLTGLDLTRQISNLM